MRVFPFPFKEIEKIKNLYRPFSFSGNGEKHIHILFWLIGTVNPYQYLQFKFVAFISKF